MHEPLFKRWILRRTTTASALVLGALALGAGCAGSQGSGAALPAGSTPGAGDPATAGSAQHNLLKASDFNDSRSLPWTTSFSAPGAGSAEVKDGAYCVTVTNKGTNNWDAQFRHREMVIQKGHSYSIQYKAWASAPTKARPKVGMAGPPYEEYWSDTVVLGTEPKTYTGKFSMAKADDPTAELAFHIGGEMASAKEPFEVCIDDIRLDDPEFRASAPEAAAAAPKVAVNQIGYLPGAIKIASVNDAATAPLAWELLDGAGKAVARGKTRVFGEDGASGDHVHLVDFTAFKAPGERYVLEVGDEKSFPFDIGAGIYQKLKVDALAYFYHNRSGIEIEMPYAGKPELARPAGHLQDKSTRCLPGSGCNYTLDASRGWYDAGDHGKYVVNGGISVWTLLNWYERTKHLGTSSADFGDGKLSIPENKNGVPDLLDEARWELEFLMGMQVPEGKPLAGMVHHKMHDDAWTGLGLAPHEDKMTRSLHKPSTAATLNVAAVGAQCARIWKTVDAAFSARCLKAAERAWAAAKQHPALYAPPGGDKGGGPYDDTDVKDELYWAAAELFVTTGKPEYKQVVQSSPLNARFPMEVDGVVSSMSWKVTDALGQISMAIVPGHVDAAWQQQLRGRIAKAADRYLAIAEKEGYRTLLQRTPAGKYEWGSNSFVLNNMLVVALAHDVTKQQKYLDGVVLGMDYLLGRNPLGQSYVTGHGDKPLQNPHHRFWAHQANSKYPKAPPGAVSGGPNSSLQDPHAQAAGLKGCVAQRCFVDHIEAWSVNEITINWNAPFAWVTAFLDEKARK
ncbi:cellulose 1,4-beta-cellobiosidase [Sorangium cellulosum]|uniref:Endoglucanase n=1 Tax=Sorangium cellulosum TaxID=56 RepID=A0A4P2PXE5_SORCE|nr:glycoside hydrolase family 9 protein [Sorangium cellulosum]AUX21479.1 cellulose 1,4-beta-cellobiosidase [Sorangium cellulosum]